MSISAVGASAPPPAAAVAAQAATAAPVDSDGDHDGSTAAPAAPTLPKGSTVSAYA